MRGRGLNVIGDKPLDKVLEEKGGYSRFVVKSNCGRYAGLVYFGFPMMFIYDLKRWECLPQESARGWICGWLQFPDDSTRLTEMLDRRELWQKFDSNMDIRFSS